MDLNRWKAAGMYMWLIYSLLAGIVFAVLGLLIRHHMKKGSDSWLVSFYFSFSFVLFFWPFLFFYEVPVFSWNIYGAMFLIGVTSLIGNTLGFEAVKTISVTTRSAIQKLRLLWLALVGVIVFSESLTLVTGFGMVCIILGSLFIIDFSKWKSSQRGVLFIVLSTITTTISGYLLKYLLGYVSMFVILFFITLAASLLFVLVIPRFVSRAKKMLIHWKFLLAIGVLGFISNILMLKALSYDVLSGVYFVMDASLVLLLVGEHFVLKEKERVWWKIAALVLVVIGTFLIQGL